MRDAHIWKELTPTDAGYTPAIKKLYLFTREGYNFPVELDAKHPSLEDVYCASATNAENLLFCCSKWVHLKDLQEIDHV